MIKAKAQIAMHSPQEGDVEVTEAGTNLLEETIDFVPKTNLDCGIKKFVQCSKEYYGID